VLIRERVAFKRTAQRKVRDDARKADEERLAALAHTGPKRIPRGALAIAVAKRKPGANYELERQKAVAKGASPVAHPARYGSLAERAQRTSTEALATLPSNMPMLPLPTSAPAQAKSVRWRASS
tara:strand:+ start:366 stop:737 length:372 start_codon:yes stop_codon:yes gene_type:complete